jgi:putative redox protein
MLYLFIFNIRKGIVANLWREIEADWQGGGAFIGRSVTGGTVQMGKLNDQPGVSPMELLLVGLAGCTGVDIVDIMAKKREPLKALKVKVRGKRADEFPQVYKEIEITYLIWGDGIKTKSIEQAIQLSEEKYCSVGIMLSAVAELHSTYQIFNSEELAS